MWVSTLISRSQIPSSVVSQVRTAIGTYNPEISDPTSLNDAQTAIEWTFSQYPETLRGTLYELATSTGVDIVVQPSTAARHKKLVVFDMDSTLIQQEVIDLIAAHAGVEPQVAAITEAAMRGELDFSQSLHQRLALLKGVDISVYDKLKTQIKLTPGAEKLAQVLRQNGVKLAVLSGGFIPLASWVKETLKLDYAQANVLEDDGRHLTGNTIGTIVDGNQKAKLLEEIANKEGIPLEYVVAVGDGSNDLPMMAKAGFGIAFNAKPLVQQRAPSRLNTGDLSDILYILGYNQLG